MEVNHRVILETPERLFLKYAFPALPCIKSSIMHKDVPENTLERLEAMLSGNSPIDRQFIETAYPGAISEMKIISPHDYWNNKIIRQYFRVAHNKKLEKDSTLPEAIKNLCWVYTEAQVTASISSNEAEVILYPTNKIRIVNTLFTPELGDAELVVVHYRHAVERTNII